MGSGKSMQMNNELFESVLAAGLDRIPYIFITDVGMTSSGLVYGIQNALDTSLYFAPVGVAGRATEASNTFNKSPKNGFLVKISLSAYKAGIVGL